MMIHDDPCHTRYGNITECDKLTDKPYGFVHMDDYQVIFTISITLYTNRFNFTNSSIKIKPAVAM